MTPLVFYRTQAGGEPVRDWLKGLPLEDRRAVGYALMRVQYGWPVGMPLCRAMGEGLHEVRVELAGRIARVMICHEGGALYALHAFVKKTQATPDVELRSARKRRQEVRDGRQ